MPCRHRSRCSHSCAVIHKAMEINRIVDYCLGKSGAYLDYPFGDIPICVKVCGRIFAEIYPNEGNRKVTLKCESMLADFYRAQYPGTVVGGYHVPNAQKRYRNTVYLHGEVPDEVLLSMLDHSYAEVVKKLKKAQREELQAPK